MRVKMLLGVLLATSSCITSSTPLTPSKGPWEFSGTVYRTDGARVENPIAGAQLTVLTGANTNAHVATDAAGHFVFTGLETGKFTLSIAAPGYISISPAVELWADLQVNFALKPQ
jgi:hypothetical protein